MIAPGACGRDATMKIPLHAGAALTGIGGLAPSELSAAAASFGDLFRCSPRARWRSSASDRQGKPRRYCSPISDEIRLPRADLAGQSRPVGGRESALLRQASRAAVGTRPRHSCGARGSRDRGGEGLHCSRRARCGGGREDLRKPARRVGSASSRTLPQQRSSSALSTASSIRPSG